jgi:hypothetical protein
MFCYINEDIYFMFIGGYDGYDDESSYGNDKDRLGRF